MLAGATSWRFESSPGHHDSVNDQTRESGFFRIWGLGLPHGQRAVELGSAQLLSDSGEQPQVQGVPWLGPPGAGLRGRRKYVHVGYADAIHGAESPANRPRATL